MPLSKLWNVEHGAVKRGDIIIKKTIETTTVNEVMRDKLKGIDIRTLRQLGYIIKRQAVHKWNCSCGSVVSVDYCKCGAYRYDL